jgi:hypothetical protein
VATRPATSLSRPPTRARTAAAAGGSGPAGGEVDDSVPPSHLARVHFLKARGGVSTGEEKPGATLGRGGSGGSGGVVPGSTASSLAYDLVNNDNWEFVMIETPALAEEEGGGESKEFGGADGGMEDVMSLRCVSRPRVTAVCHGP